MTPPNPQLLRSLGKLARGLSALFWGLPATLLISAETARADWLKPLGMLPLLATAVVAATGNIYSGLWYPIGVAVMTLVIGLLFLRDTKGVDISTGSGVEQQSK